MKNSNNSDEKKNVYENHINYEIRQIFNDGIYSIYELELCFSEFIVKLRKASEGRICNLEIENSTYCDTEGAVSLILYRKETAAEFEKRCEINKKQRERAEKNKNKKDEKKLIKKAIEEEEELKLLVKLKAKYELSNHYINS